MRHSLNRSSSTRCFIDCLQECEPQCSGCKCRWREAGGGGGPPASFLFHGVSACTSCKLCASNPSVAPRSTAPQDSKQHPTTLQHPEDPLHTSPPPPPNPHDPPGQSRAHALHPSPIAHNPHIAPQPFDAKFASPQTTTLPPFRGRSTTPRIRQNPPRPCTGPSTTPRSLHTVRPHGRVEQHAANRVSVNATPCAFGVTFFDCGIHTCSHICDMGFT